MDDPEAVGHRGHTERGVLLSGGAVGGVLAAEAVVGALGVAGGAVGVLLAAAVFLGREVDPFARLGADDDSGVPLACQRQDGAPLGDVEFDLDGRLVVLGVAHTSTGDQQRLNCSLLFRVSLVTTGELQINLEHRITI